MHLNPSTVLARLQRVVRDRIRPQLHRPLADVSVITWRVDGDGEPVPAARALGLDGLAPDYQPLAIGDTWAPAWGTTWLRVEGRVVPGTDSPVELLLDLGWFDHSVGGHCEGLEPDRPVSVAALLAGTRLTCRVSLRNDGPGPASAVVQLYLHRVTASTWPRVRELRSFQHVEVPAGASVTVQLPVGAAQLSTADDSGRPRLQAGVVEIQTGLSATEITVARLTLV